MSTIPLLPGIHSQMIDTPRIRLHVRFSGPDDGIPVLLVHGNVSSATFWEETMLALPNGYRAIAPDLRGYGDTEFKPVDATRGLADFAEDMLALMDTLGIDRFHAVGHSLGGSVVYALMLLGGARLRSVTLAAPGSPYGYGGTKDIDGTPVWPDYAGSGGGLVNPNFVKRLSEGDRSADDPQASPRVVMNSFYWKPPFRPAREEELLSSMLAIHVGPDHYPGDLATSENWPGVGPGAVGPNNSLSPKYVGDSVEHLVAAAHKPAILWLRGIDDQIVGDMSLFDIGTLGKLGAVPGWPGDEIYPPQPMVSQTRAVFERYAAAGGRYHEVVLTDCGHTPFIEKPEEFNSAFHAHLAAY
ncbi:MAG: alpha/beta fold hydrolase [Oscillochloris sp.]|nr:alpha/beta fold hydrolase [Oscillochloris sp.]